MADVEPQRTDAMYPSPEQPTPLFSCPVTVVQPPDEAEKEKLKYEAALHIEKEYIRVDAGAGTDAWRLKLNDIREISIRLHSATITTFHEEIILGPFTKPTTPPIIDSFAQILLKMLHEWAIPCGI